MVKGVVGAVLVSFAAWVVMRSLGVAGPDDNLYADLLRQAWGAVLDVVAWVPRAPENWPRAVLIVAAVAGFMLGAKSGN